MTRFGFLGTYPPTRCGIATFTAALASTVTGGGDEAVVVRVDDLVPAGPAVPAPGLHIGAVLRPGDPAGRARAIEVLDTCDVVVVQHEYGIYGGPDGDEVLDVLARLRPPTVVVMHTVLASPTAGQRRVMHAIRRHADAVVAMTSAAVTLLEQQYAIPTARLHEIPHGVDAWTPVAVAERSARPVVLSWGLIGPGKGIEWGIGAMALLHDLDPAPVYRVLGQTHPKVLRQHGERYRDSLRALAERLGVSGSVELHGRYQEAEELAREVAAADIVLLPYDSTEQATSGVLAEATAAGKLVVATRFPHAVELLTGGSGVLVDQQRPDQIADAVRGLLGDPERARAAGVRARQAAPATSWEAVADRYRELAAVLTGVSGVSAASA